MIEGIGYEEPISYNYQYKHEEREEHLLQREELRGVGAIGWGGRVGCCLSVSCGFTPLKNRLDLERYEDTDIEQSEVVVALKKELQGEE